MAHLIKRGDPVVVISGAHKNKRGKVLRILREENRVIVEGVALIKRHTKARSEKEKGGDPPLERDAGRALRRPPPGGRRGGQGLIFNIFAS
jgi:ribosomal protein L24